MHHPTAIISPNAKLGVNVTVGPYTVIDENVEIGDNCRIGPHCHITGCTRIGSGAKVHVGAVIGDEPQDHSFSGDPSFTNIGKNCTIREYVTIHRGADPDSATTIGDNVMLMAFVHLGHNCSIGDHVNIANMTILGGHVHIGNNAFLSSGIVAHQFVKVGQYAMVSANARLNKDVPPYCMLAEGDRIYGANSVGIKRAGFSKETRNAIRQAIKLFFFSDSNSEEALAEIAGKFGGIPEVNAFIDFVKSSQRGMMTARPKREKS